MTIWRRLAYWISKATRAQAHAHACAPTATNTYTSTHAYEGTNPRAHTRTNKYVIIIAFPRQQ